MLRSKGDLRKLTYVHRPEFLLHSVACDEVSNAGDFM